MNRTAGLPASAWHPHIHRRKKSTRRAWGLASWPPPMGGVGGWVGLSWYACGIFSSARRRTSTSVWPMCTPHTTLRCVPRRTRKAEGRVAGRGRGVWWGWVGRRGEKGQLKQPHAPPPPPSPFSSLPGTPSSWPPPGSGTTHTSQAGSRSAMCLRCLYEGAWA